MKKVIVLIALIVAPAVSFGQSIFDKLENMESVSSVVINKDAFEILSKFNLDSNDSEEMEIFKIIQNLKEFKVFKTSNSGVSTKMEQMVSNEIKKSKLTLLMRAKDEGSKVRIYVKTGKNKNYVSEVLMFVNGISERTNGQAESVVLSLTGMIDINKISKIADKYSKDSKKNKK